MDTKFYEFRQIKKGFILVDILATRDQVMEDLRDTSVLPKVLLKLTGSWESRQGEIMVGRSDTRMSITTSSFQWEIYTTA